jgi:hypothetical protein
MAHPLSPLDESSAALARSFVRRFREREDLKSIAMRPVTGRRIRRQITVPKIRITSLLEALLLGAQASFGKITANGKR